MSVLAPIRKALVPVGVAVVMWALARVGVVETPELAEQVVLVVTAVLVYFIPNNGAGA